MIRVVIVDDHPALRAGVETVLQSDPRIVCTGGSAGDEESLWPLLRSVQPDVVLLDYHLPRGDGLQLCYRITREVPPPKVIIFSPYAGPDLLVPAKLAGAAALLNKAVGARELLETIHRVGEGNDALDEPSVAMLRAANVRISGDERALVGMLLDGATEGEVARTVGMDARDVRHAVQRILSELRVAAPV